MKLEQRGPAVGLLCQFAVLAVLAVSVGLGPGGWGAGAVYGVAVCALLSAATARRGRGFGPADWVTMARSALAGGAAALVADSWSGAVPVAWLVSLAALTIVLDAADGWLARRTGTTSDLGARFDMEVDAFLIFVLSLFVAPAAGAWVLLIGLARYVFVAAGWFLPWLRAEAPARHWSKVVAVVQGVVLVAAASGLLPHPAAVAALAVALVLLAESFGRQVRWLWRHRRSHPGRIHVPAVVFAAASALAVWCVLLLPATPAGISFAAFASIPLGWLLLLLAAVVLTPGWRRPAAVAAGVLLACLLVFKALNLGFTAAFERPFDPVNDWYYLGPGAGVLGDSIGRAGALAVIFGLVLCVAGALVLLPLAVLRLNRTATRDRGASARLLTALGTAWVIFAVTGLQWGPGLPLASTSSAAFVSSQFGRLHHDLTDRGAFAALIAREPFQGVAGGGLLDRLHGKDVLLVFVESYGRTAVEGRGAAPGVKAVLAARSGELEAAGYSSRSAFLASPTFGGASWLAHSTLQSGLWVDSQQRYNQLLTTPRMTLSGAFSQAGWRTAFAVPANTMDWPQGRAFYGFDALYDARNMGYAGPKFSYATMPDQYVLSAFSRLELARSPRLPVMAEIDLVSSHAPWTPLPGLVPWEDVGDGSVFIGMPARGLPPASVAGNAAKVRELYEESIRYSLTAVLSFATAHPDPNLVLIVLGDHQPTANVSGSTASHEVPISIIAGDPSVLEQISSWGWQEGLLPDPGAAAWPMSDFRDRFLAAYSSGAGSPAALRPAGGANPPAAPRDAAVHSTIPPTPR